MSSETSEEYIAKMRARITAPGFGDKARAKHRAMTPARTRLQGSMEVHDWEEKKKKRVQHEALPTGEIIAYVRSIGGYAFRCNNLPAPIRGEGGQITGYRPVSVPGVSDIIGVLPDGRAFACEVKAPGRKARPDQLAFITKFNECGGVALVAYGVADVQLELDRRKQVKQGAVAPAA